IGAGNRALAMPAQSLGKGWHPQGPAGGTPHPVAEIRRPGRMADQTLALVERHRVAEEAMARRPAAGRDRGGAGPGGRRKDAAMRREGGGTLPQFGEKRRRLGIDQIGAQAVADDDDGPRNSTRLSGHGPTPFSAKSKISKLRNRRDSDIAR